jgi:hypothetical protein
MSSWNFSTTWATMANYPVLIDASVSAPATTDTGYYDPFRIKRLASLAVKVTPTANPETITPTSQASIGITAAVSGRPSTGRN